MDFEKLKKECKNKTLLCVGPVSRATTKAVINFANESDIPMVLIPSRRQVDFDGGYVYETKEFTNLVRGLDTNRKILIARDHRGTFSRN